MKRPFALALAALIAAAPLALHADDTMDVVAPFEIQAPEPSTSVSAMPMRVKT